MTAGDLTIDVEERRVTISGNEVKLTPKEFDVLKHLARHAGKVVTHRAPLSAVWGSESTDQTEYLRVCINQLRSKIEPNPQKPRYIMTEPWVGYRFISKLVSQKPMSMAYCAQVCFEVSLKVPISAAIEDILLLAECV